MCSLGWVVSPLWASLSYSVKEVKTKTQSETVGGQLGSAEIVDKEFHWPCRSLRFESWKDNRVCPAAAQVKYLLSTCGKYVVLQPFHYQGTKPPENCFTGQ